MSDPKLTKDGQRLREAIAEAGVEVTPTELAEAFVEARQRIRPGPDGKCVKCGHDGSDGRDFRYGLCDVCAFCAEAGCLASPGTTGRCLDHGGDGKRFPGFCDSDPCGGCGVCK